MPVEHHELAGWQAVTLASDRLRVTVLPERGAELHGLLHVDSGVDVLLQAPWGLQPPGAAPREGSDGHVFLERYAGGWQELFPSANDPCTYGGAEIPFHGEVAILPWQHETLRDEGGDVEVAFRVTCRTLPLALERRMSLAAGSGTLTLDETAVNLSDAPVKLTWGHHCVLGPPFIEAGCRLALPARTITTIPEMWEDTARLAPGQRSTWPNAQLRTGGTVDLREVPGPEAGSHDDVYLTDLEVGEASVENPRLGLAFRLGFDPSIFRWIISWQPYGGAQAPPLTGAYGLGVEPWVSALPLAAAAEAGEAIELGPRASLATRVTATIEGANA